MWLDVNSAKNCIEATITKDDHQDRHTAMTKHNAVWTDEMVNRDEAFSEDDVDEELDHYWDYRDDE